MDINQKYKSLVDFIKSLYFDKDPVSLHEPVFIGNEKKYLLDCIESTFVSYVGHYVDKFEKMTAQYTEAKYAIATVNGTAALHIALKVAGIAPGDEVITQSLTFVATANAIVQAGAVPVFVDVDLDTMGMSPEKLEDWLKKSIKYDRKNGQIYNRITGKRIAGIIPVHTFGHPCRVSDIVTIGGKYNVPIIEDSAEAIGSFYHGKHTGTFGLAGILSFNGNKIITTGGGGMIITNDEFFAKKAKHLSTTAKVPHPWEFIHDEVGYNYRMPNVNAAIGVAQMENIDMYLKNKREIAEMYKSFCKEHEILFVTEPEGARSNYWLNAIILKDRQERDAFLEYSNRQGVMTRPAWRLLNKLEMYKNCQHGDLSNALWLEDRIVNIPSGVRHQRG